MSRSEWPALTLPVPWGTALGGLPHPFGVSQSGVRLLWSQSQRAACGSCCVALLGAALVVVRGAEGAEVGVAVVVGVVDVVDVGGPVGAASAVVDPAAAVAVPVEDASAGAGPVWGERGSAVGALPSGHGGAMLRFVGGLAACSACGGQMSRQAKACPACGHPSPRPWWPQVLAVVVVTIVLALIIGNTIQGNSQRQADELVECVMAGRTDC